MKKYIALLIMTGVFNVNANWEISFQYGSIPCQLAVSIFDAFGNPITSFLTPPQGTNLNCRNANPPAYAVITILGMAPITIDVDSTTVVSLPCLGGANYTFNFSKSTSSGSCDTTYYLNY